MLILGITTNGKIGLGLVALAFIAFALVSSFVLPRRNPDFPGERVGAFVAAAALLFAALMLSVFFFARESEEGGEGGEATQAESTATTETGGGAEAPAGDATAGEAVFASAGCGGCHTLKAANSSGQVGPNLDEAKPEHDLVIERVTNGMGVMPSFKGQLSDKQIEDVAAYVVKSTSG